MRLDRKGSVLSKFGIICIPNQLGLHIKQQFSWDLRLGASGSRGDFFFLILFIYGGM